MTDVPDPWQSFSLDPRDPAHAGLRAADRDREVISALLSAAYGEGRLDREELDERTETLGRAKTLGELPGLVDDLVPPPRPASTSTSLVRASRSDLERMAREDYAADRRSAVFGFLGTSLVCWVVWLVITGGGDSFPWPAIVSVVTFLNVVRTVSNREESIRKEVRRLEKKQTRQLKPPDVAG